MKLKLNIFIILLSFVCFKNVYANNLPDTLFGIQLFDSINNYNIGKKFEQKNRNLYVLNSAPNQNDSFNSYVAITYPNDDKIVSIRGLIKRIEIATPVKLFKEQPKGEPKCAAEHLPKYITALSNAWQVREGKFSDLEIKYYGSSKPPQNLKKSFGFNATRIIEYKKNNVELVANVRCLYFYYSFGDEIDGVPVTNPTITANLEITISTREYVDKYIPKKIYKLTVGDFIRKLYDGVDTQGF